jgi:ABC-type transporter Mla subunit MlaD
MARAVRKATTDHGAQYQADAYGRTLNAVEDAIEARSKTRFDSALSHADIALGQVEKAFDRAEPPWRRFLRNFGV